MRPVLLAVAFALTSVSVSAHADGSKTEEIRKLLAITGSAQLGTQVMGQLMGTMKQSMPNVPDKFWSDFQKEVRADELIDLIVPVYDKNLSQDDVRALIKFYETPTGKRFVAALPIITQQSMAVGQEWGRGIAQRVVDRLKAEESKSAPAEGGKKTKGK